MTYFWELARKMYRREIINKTDRTRWGGVQRKDVNSSKADTRGG